MAAALPGPSRPVRLAVLAALALVTVALFAPALDFDFVSYDDWEHVRDNPAIREGLGGANLVRAFADTPYLYNWIPLTYLSYLADFELSGLDPRGFHRTNLLLHAAGAVLLLLALARASGAFWPSAFAAAVFAVHPLQVEPVVWVSSRKDVLAGVCFAATLWAYARYAERPGAARYAAVLLGTALGLLSKPILVALPFVLLLLDFWPLRRVSLPGDAQSWRRIALEKLPLLALAGAVLAVTFEVQPVVSAGGNAFGARLENAVDATFDQIESAFWPSGLAVFYPHPRGALPLAPVLAEAAALALVSLGVLVSARRRPHLPVGWLWFLGVLFPVMGFVEVGLQARADRYMYLPLVGLAVMVAWSGRELAARSRPARAAVCAAALAALALLCAATRAQLPYWRDSTALYARAVAVTEGNYVAHYGLAGALGEQGRLDEALAQLSLAAEADPGWPLPYERMAEIHSLRGEYAKAAEIYRALIPLRADNALWHAALADNLLRLGDADGAVRHYRAAREGGDLRPATADALAWLLATGPEEQGRDPAEAARIASEALATARSQRASLLDTLAAARAAAGDPASALALAAQARDLAQEQGDAALAAGISARADLYRAGRPFVQSTLGPK